MYFCLVFCFIDLLIVVVQQVVGVRTLRSKEVFYFAPEGRGVREFVRGVFYYSTPGIVAFSAEVCLEECLYLFVSEV